jgi:hypothetical protein
VKVPTQVRMIRSRVLSLSRAKPICRAITSAITDAIRLVGCGTIPCLVGHILLVAVGLVCIILLIKAGFDRAEARSKTAKHGKKD